MPNAKKVVNGLLLTERLRHRDPNDFEKIVTTDSRRTIPLRDITGLRELGPTTLSYGAEEAIKNGCKTVIFIRDESYPVYAVEDIDVLTARMNGTSTESK